MKLTQKVGISTIGFMKSITLPYGDTDQISPVPENWRRVIESSYRLEEKSFETMVRGLWRLHRDSPASDYVKRGERVCIVFSDITRSWQQTEGYLPLLVEELEQGGVLPEHITLLCALVRTGLTVKRRNRNWWAPYTADIRL